MDKEITRQRLLAARAALSPEQVAADSALVCQHLAEWPPFQQARTVLAYLAFDNEVSLQTLIDGHPGKAWALPRTLRGGVLALHRYQPGRLVRHRWGMLEPSADAPPVPPDEIDLALVPGVGFDQQGGRLGFGGGYYDRLLPQLSCLKVGIAHLASCVPLVPCDAHDCCMDWLARPDGLIRVRPEAG
jgi:5-formyltetrahydrofolate cyclo-ligase